MLRAHFNAVEQGLLALGRIPENAGHALHIGTPREAFARHFLGSHLSGRVALGTGEIIDAASAPGERRNQHDIVIYKTEYPKLVFGGGISAYLAESVAATIEVKSTLTKDDVLPAVRSAARVKRLKRSLVEAFHAGYQPPAVLNYIVAYDGPAKMETVRAWVNGALAAEGLVLPSLSVQREARLSIASPALDGVFVLGKGFVYFNNVPVGLDPAPLPSVC